MAAADPSPLLRQLPSVDEVLRSEDAAALLDRYPRWAVVEAARAEIGRERSHLRKAADGDTPVPDTDILTRVNRRLAASVQELLAPHLRRTLNATGVVLHTNLGRAPLARRALDRMREVAAGYSTLEYDPGARGRGSRQDHLQAMLTALTGAEAAAVVNNNAGAVLLALATLAAGREVIVSRGELVEIGGGFRIPDVMRASGARLVEVGTTNKTRLGDYLNGAGAETALYLKVHRSNFALVGFTEETSVTELAAAARSARIPLVVDLGSGSLVDLAPHGLPGEPPVSLLIEQGADLCTFSGDKLLGGPQAGILLGRRDLIERIRQHPLMRALRPDKLSLAALEATLELYREGTALEEIPTLRMLVAPLAELEARKERLLALLRAADLPLDLGARQMRSAVGGGALPLAEPETWTVTLRHRSHGAERFAARLGDGRLPLVTRIVDGQIVLDVRTLEGGDLEDAAARVVAACHREPTPSSGD